MSFAADDFDSSVSVGNVDAVDSADAAAAVVAAVVVAGLALLKPQPRSQASPVHWQLAQPQHPGFRPRNLRIPLLVDLRLEST